MPRTANALGVLSCVLLLAACASGPERGERGGPGQGASQPSQVVSPDALIFLEFDTDKDRKITRAELDRGIEADWTEAAKAAPSIGYLEWQDWLVKVIGSADFDVGPVGFDTNADLRITKDEFATALKRRFAALDVNSDGVIERSEFVKRTLGRGLQGIGPVRSGGEDGRERGRRGGGGPGGDGQGGGGPQ